MADLTNTLILAASADKNAENKLKEWETANFPEFINALVVEIATEGKDLRARQLAGLYVKNMLFANDDSIQFEKHEKWKSLPGDVRAPVKKGLLAALQSQEQVARHTAAQAAAEVATIELPFQAWPEFLPALLENVTSDVHPEGAKVASLECLGYSCERIAVLTHLPEIPDTVTNAMLTTIVDGIQTSRPNNIRLAAAAALKNSLIFSIKNMAKKEERDTIMNSICEATICEDARVRAEAYGCIVNIAYHYYEHLQQYMITLFELTTKTIRSDQEEVAKEAIEFWNTIAEVEMELIDEENENAALGMQSETRCQRYVQAAVEHIVPILLETMTKQEEDADLDGDQFTLAIAAGTCLGLVAQTVEDLITPAVLPFVQKNIQSDNWHYREAATMAFACILDGVNADSISSVVHESIPVLMQALNDPSDQVKDTTIFTISKICEMHSRAIPGNVFPMLVNGLVEKLSVKSTRVAHQACNALHKLGTAFDGDDTGERTGTNPLSPFLQNLLQQLMNAADRPDANEHNLRVAAFEAVNVFVQNSAPDSRALLLQLLPAAIDRLRTSFSLPVITTEDKDAKEGLQGLLCGLIQVLCQKLEKSDVLPHADNIMTGLLEVLQSKNATCHAESFSAISAVADLMSEDFEKYMPALQPFLIAGLKQYDAFEVCKVSVGLVGDISRALEMKIQPFTQEIMSALIDSLRDTTLHRSVKPPVLGCFGDIALAINAAFEPFVSISMQLLVQAAGTDAPPDDEEMIEYINDLRDSVLEACTGIVQGLKDGSRLDLFLPYRDAILAFLQKISADQNRDEQVLNKAVGLIGDIASSFGASVKDPLNQQYISTLLQCGLRSGDQATLETAQWALAQVQQVVQS